MRIIVHFHEHVLRLKKEVNRENIKNAKEFWKVTQTKLGIAISRFFSIDICSIGKKLPPDT